MSLFRKNNKQPYNPATGAVIEFGTGYLISGYLAMWLPVKHELSDFLRSMYAGRGMVSIPEDKKAYFRVGNAPKCDYIKKDSDGNVSYWKNQPDVQVDVKGEILSTTKKSK